MIKTDFSQPQRMSKGAFFIIFSKRFIRSIAPIVTASLIIPFNSSSERNLSVWLIILLALAGCVSIALIEALISYFSKKFYVKDGNLIFIHGVINREDTCVPLDRIHSLRTEKGIWYRLLDMRGIVFDTLATKQEEIELILDEHEWQQLLSLIEKEEKPQPSPSATDPPEYNPTSTVSYPTKNLLLAALCQNHLKGMAVLGSVLALVFGNLSDLPKSATDTVENYLEMHFEELITSPFKIIFFFAILYLFILMLWLGRVLLRYYDTTMRYDKKLLTFTYGLFTRSSCRFLHNKICTIRIKRNYLEKRFGFCTLMLKQAVNASANKEEDNMKLYGTDSSAFFLKWWLGEDYLEASNVIAAKSGKGAFFHSIFLRSLIAITVSIILYHFQLYPWLIIPLFYFLFILPKGICTMRHSKIELKSSYFIIHTGAFAEIANYIKYSNLEVVGIRRSPLTKWFHRMSLALSTSGTTFFIRSIKEDKAKLMYEFLLFKAEIKNESTIRQ